MQGSSSWWIHGDANLLPVAIATLASLSMTNIALERFLIVDACAALHLHPPCVGNAEASAAAATWLRWVFATRIGCNLLSMPLLGPISDVLRARQGSRAPLLALQLCAGFATPALLLCQATLGWERSIAQLGGAFLTGAFGGEANALIASFYAVRADLLVDAPKKVTAHQHSSAFLRLQFSSIVGHGLGALLAASLLQGEGLLPFVRTFGAAAACALLGVVLALCLPGRSPTEPQSYPRAGTPTAGGHPNPLAKPDIGTRLATLGRLSRSQPGVALPIAVLYVLINFHGGFGAIFVLYLSNLGWSVAATAQLMAVGSAVGGGAFLFAQELVRTVSPARALAAFALVAAMGDAALGTATTLASWDLLVGFTALVGHALTFSLALLRAIVLAVVPPDHVGTTMFVLGILDQLATLAGSFGFSSAFAATAASWAAASAWLACVPALACVPIALQLEAAHSCSASDGRRGGLQPMIVMLL